jgi:methyl-accepting chemotaxis protein
MALWKKIVSVVRTNAKSILASRPGKMVAVSDLPHASQSALPHSVDEDVQPDTDALPGKTQHDMIRTAARDAAAKIEKLFEEAIATGRITHESLFDRTYTAIPDTNPQKYSSRFDTFTDQVLPEVQDKILDEMPNVAYAGAIDNKGYTPTHNLKFSQPLTGNYKIDLANNRTKRFFSDQAGMRCATNTKPFLLQTYMRDTGEVMHDLSVPIYVGNKHWGAFRIGYRSNLE